MALINIEHTSMCDQSGNNIYMVQTWIMKYSCMCLIAFFITILWSICPSISAHLGWICILYTIYTFWGACVVWFLDVIHAHYLYRMAGWTDHRLDQWIDTLLVNGHILPWRVAIKFTVIFENCCKLTIFFRKSHVSAPRIKMPVLKLECLTYVVKYQSNALNYSPVENHYDMIKSQWWYYLWPSHLESARVTDRVSYQPTKW